MSKHQLVELQSRLAARTCGCQNLMHDTAQLHRASPYATNGSYRTNDGLEISACNICYQDIKLATALVGPTWSKSYHSGAEPWALQCAYEVRCQSSECSLGVVMDVHYTPVSRSNIRYAPAEQFEVQGPAIIAASGSALPSYGYGQTASSHYSNGEDRVFRWQEHFFDEVVVSAMVVSAMTSVKPTAYTFDHRMLHDAIWSQRDGTYALALTAVLDLSSASEPDIAQLEAIRRQRGKLAMYAQSDKLYKNSISGYLRVLLEAYNDVCVQQYMSCVRIYTDRKEVQVNGLQHLYW